MNRHRLRAPDVLTRPPLGPFCFRDSFNNRQLTNRIGVGQLPKAYLHELEEADGCIMDRATVYDPCVLDLALGNPTNPSACKISRL